MVQRPHVSGKVVSVRLPDEIITRLDALSERTSRSRGFYLKLAIAAMLEQMEKYHWDQVAAGFDNRSIESEFLQMMFAGLPTATEDKDC